MYNLDMEKLLIVVAHHDDAELMFGGIINHCSSIGYKVEILVVTDGSSWYSNIKKGENITKVRCKEQNKAAKLLGVSKIHYLNFQDGFISYNDIETPLLESIRKINPTLIFTHSPTEFHNDHKVIYSVVNRLCNCIDEPPLICNPFVMQNVAPVQNFKRLYYYARCSDIALKDIRFFELTQKDIDRKCEALKCYKSQSNFVKNLQKIKNESKFYGGLVGCDYAEIIIEQPMIRYKKINSLLE